MNHALRSAQWAPPNKDRDLLFDRDLRPANGAGRAVRNTRKKRKQRGNARD